MRYHCFGISEAWRAVLEDLVGPMHKRMRLPRGLTPAYENG